MDKVDLEREFGVGYKEKMNKAFIADFAPDEETRKLFDDLCFEINNCNLSNDEIVKLLAVFPANIGLTIARNIDRKDEILKVLLDLYFEEYVKGSNKIKRGKSDFDRRIAWKKTDNAESFLSERLFTLTELDNLIRLEGEKSEELVAKYQYADVEYTGQNVRLKKLLEVRRIVSKAEYTRKTNDMINKIKHMLFNNVLNILKRTDRVEI